MMLKLLEAGFPDCFNLFFMIAIICSSIIVEQFADIKRNSRKLAEIRKFSPLKYADPVMFFRFWGRYNDYRQREVPPEILPGPGGTQVRSSDGTSSGQKVQPFLGEI